MKRLFHHIAIGNDISNTDSSNNRTIITGNGNGNGNGSSSHLVPRLLLPTTTRHTIQRIPHDYFRPFSSSLAPVKVSKLISQTLQEKKQDKRLDLKAIRDELSGTSKFKVVEDDENVTRLKYKTKKGTTVTIHFDCRHLEYGEPEEGDDPYGGEDYKDDDDDDDFASRNYLEGGLDVHDHDDVEDRDVGDEDDRDHRRDKKKNKGKGHGDGDGDGEDDDFDDDDDDDDIDDELMNHNTSHRYTVELAKGEKRMVFIRAAQYGDFETKEFASPNADLNAILTNPTDDFGGIDFTDLPRDLQQKVEEILEKEYGIDFDVDNFVFRYSKAKKEKKVIEWLRNAKSIFP